MTPLPAPFVAGIDSHPTAPNPTNVAELEQGGWENVFVVEDEDTFLSSCTKYFPTTSTNDYDALSAFLTIDGPKRIADFINDPRWQAAIAKHVEKLTGKQAYQWRQVPDNATMLRGLWVLQTKIDDDTGKSEDKARLVGDGRRHAITDDTKLYAATPDAETTKLFTAVAVERDMTCSKFDVVGAYLEVPQPDPIYMWAPAWIPYTTGEKRERHGTPLAESPQWPEGWSLPVG